MRYPTRYRKQYPRYPTGQRTVNRLINAGVTLGTVAIGAHVLTSIFGSLNQK